MDEGTRSTARCLVVWLLATAALAATVRWVGAAAASLGRPATWQGGFEDLLVAVCAAVLLVCGVRLWLVVAATALDLLRGRVPGATPGATRRLVLLACGAAVAAGAAGPAAAGEGDALERIAGLPLPDRATVGSPARSGAEPPAERRAAPAVRRGTTPGGEVVVRSGDSLWTLAAARLPRSAGPAEVDRAWRVLYAANRAEIGTDPDLIRPGQRLHLPGPRNTPTTPTAPRRGTP